MIDQGEARQVAKRLCEETGRIHIADTVKPSTREGNRWRLGGWPDKTSRWVVIDTHVSTSVSTNHVSRRLDTKNYEIVYPASDNIQ